MTKLEFTRSDEKATAILKAVRLIDEGAELAPVVHGYWINIPPYHAHSGNYNKAQECSVCRAFYVSSGNTPYPNHPFCAECGAKMDLKEDNHGQTD